MARVVGHGVESRGCGHRVGTLLGVEHKARVEAAGGPGLSPRFVLGVE